MAKITWTPALFLDRDGVVVEDGDYLFRPTDLQVIPEVAKLIAECNRLHWPVFVLTNQSGIARGLYSEADYLIGRSAIAQKLAQWHARIDFELASAYLPDKSTRLSQDETISFSPEWRKPNPGMLLEIFKRFPNVDPQQSWMIGNSFRDLLAAEKSGVHHLVLFEGRSDESLNPQEVAHLNYSVCARHELKHDWLVSLSSLAKH